MTSHQEQLGRLRIGIEKGWPGYEEFPMALTVLSEHCPLSPILFAVANSSTGYSGSIQWADKVPLGALLQCTWRLHKRGLI